MNVKAVKLCREAFTRHKSASIMSASVVNPQVRPASNAGREKGGVVQWCAHHIRTDSGSKNDWGPVEQRESEQLDSNLVVTWTRTGRRPWWAAATENLRVSLRGRDCGRVASEALR